MTKTSSSKTSSPGETRLMAQWREAKAAHPDALILFRMGDFYETFEDDARIASEVLGIALTKRSNQGRSSKKGPAADIPLAGFPYHSLENHLHKLLAAGHRVALCEQVEDPKLAKGIVKREVVEVVTPGTAMTDKFLDGSKNNYLVALAIGDGRAGLARLDASTGEFSVEELPLGDLTDRLFRYQPTEILVPESQQDDLRYMLNATGALLTPYMDWIADVESATGELTRHFGISTLKGFGIQDLPLGIGAAGAALHYLQQNRPGANAHITSLRPVAMEGLVVLDDFTVRNLEIFSSLATQGTHGTLISVIDRTSTPPGARLLKQWLRTPLRNRPAIERRLDRVEALTKDSHLREDIRELLGEVSDLERILGRVATGKASPRDVVNIATSLEALDRIAELVEQQAGAPLNDLLKGMEATGELVTGIRTAMVDEAPLLVSRGGVIKPGFNAELDDLRELSGSGKSWIAAHQASERERTGIPSLKIGYNNVFGYYLEVTKTHAGKVPDNYIRKQTLVNAERYITPELKEQEEQLLTAEEKILALEQSLFDALQEEIVLQTSQVQVNAGILARLDIAVALAEVAQRQSFVRPVIEEDQRLFIRDGRHPVVETLLPMGEAFTPNDLEMDPAENQIHIITGPNMSGKSTYLRQIGLIVILGHMGSFVPATEARIGLVDRVFTRVGASDNLAGGESTFLVEMVETANILNNATPRSLILLDEIGRGTSTYDGLSIAWAVTEYLHQHGEVAGKTLFATHYHELVALADTLPRVRNFNVAVKEHGQEVVFLRKIIPGGTDRSYGIHVAQMAGLPEWIIKRAGEILTSLVEQSAPAPATGTEQRPEAQIDLFAERQQALAAEFNEIKVENLTPIEALNLLDSLKKKHGL